MKIKEALEVVLNLAEQNALDILPEDNAENEELGREAVRQEEAIEMVQNYIKTMK